MNKIDKNTLLGIYSRLTPNINGSVKVSVQSETLTDIIKRLILDHRGIFYSYKQIYDEIGNYITKKGTGVEDFTVKDVGLYIHAIDSSLGRIDFQDENYWTSTVKTLGSFVPSISTADSSGESINTDFVSSAFVIRGPFISPSTRATREMDFFLNYIPNIQASQMVPYLNVEFQIRRPLYAGAENYTTAPGTLRFLLGSVNSADLKSPADKFMVSSDTYTKNSDNSSEKMVHAGMEMFLMPQTLTDMDNLSERGLTREAARFTRVKPFVPFASIESFDVSVQNAGAGMIAHKKGTLKFRIHDKGRMGELSEFLKSSEGFSQAIIWTTYGWVAPQGREEDHYSNFINDNMIIRECWTVMNSQFSFDQSGQLVLNLDLISRPAKTIMSSRVAELGGSEKLKQFHKIIQSFSDLKTKVKSSDKFNINVLSEQILNAASTNGMLLDIKNIDTAALELAAALRAGGLPPAEIAKVEEDLQKLKTSLNYDNVKQDVKIAVEKKFNKLNNDIDSPDPFLAEVGKQDYFSDSKGAALINEISLTTRGVRTYNEEIKKTSGAGKKSKDKKKANPVTPASSSAANNKPEENKPGIDDKLTLQAKMASFGRVFLDFIVPSIKNSDTCDEVQVFFYALNNSCGPMSGLSIAEFPIDLERLAYAYREAVKNSSTESLQLQSFLKLLIETQFSDKRSVGYGMNQFYKPWDYSQPTADLELVNSGDGVKAGLAQWFKDYGAFKPPIIEMYVEEGEEGSSRTNVVASLKNDAFRTLKDKAEGKSTGGDRRIIRRIHIYDRANNPYEFLQKVVNTGSGFELGSIDGGKLRGVLDGVISKYGIETARAVEDYIKLVNQTRDEGITLSDALRAKGVSDEDLTSIEVVEKPYGNQIRIGRDRKSLKEFLMTTVPTIRVGSNGSMVIQSNVSSKVDGTIGAINLVKTIKGQQEARATLSDNALEQIDGLPLRTVPVQLTMTTVGVPIAQLYQLFFVDFDTGTSLDNIYNCTQVTHNLAPGKFTTNMTFMYQDGYAKFSGAPGLESMWSGQLKDVIDEMKRSGVVPETTVTVP
jgi:hypothetical protein